MSVYNMKYIQTYFIVNNYFGSIYNNIFGMIFNYHLKNCNSYYLYLIFYYFYLVYWSIGPFWIAMYFLMSYHVGFYFCLIRALITLELWLLATFISLMTMKRCFPFILSAAAIAVKWFECGSLETCEEIKQIIIKNILKLY